jgi:hypothetical protein
MNLGLIIELQALNSFEALLEERLNTEWVLCLRENFEQLRVRQKEESREKTSLGLQVLVETLLDFLKLGVSIEDDVVESRDLDDAVSAGVVFDSLHERAPVLVDLSEFVTFNRHLLHDVLRTEDGLQIHPNALDLEPHFNIVLSLLKQFFPFDDLIQEVLGVRRALHCLRPNEMVIKCLLDQFN